MLSCTVSAWAQSVVLECNTMYHGVQDVKVQKTDSGYILRDTERGIITLDGRTGTDVFDTPEYNKNDADIYKKRSYIESCLDYTFTQEQLLNSVFTARLDSFDLNIAKKDDFPDIDDFDLPEDNADNVDKQYIIKLQKNGETVFTSSPMNAETTYTFSLPNVAINPTEDVVCASLFEVNDADEETLIVKKDCVNMLFDNYATTIEATDEREGFKILPYCTCDSRLPAIAAHWGMQKTVDAYKEMFNRNSYGDNGEVIYQVINIPKGNGQDNTFSVNAAAIRFEGTELPNYYFMGYGMGGLNKNQLFTPVVVLDVMAHEFTHLVTYHTKDGGLKYTDESGALNESASDCLAMAIMNHINPEWKNWLIGDKCLSGDNLMRNMADPKDPRSMIKNQPSTYKAGSWSDNGDVHCNSAVPNYAFYLLCDGGSGINDLGNKYSVEGISIEKGAQILYHSLTNLYHPETSFAEAREAWMQSAEILFGEAVAEVRAVANAWHAVGVGDRYADTGLSAPDCSKLVDNVIYDVTGRIVNSKDMKNSLDIYIKNGKKITVR